MTRERLVKCFEAADPGKLSDIDGLLLKYQGRERVMFTKVQNKYLKYPQCAA